MVTLGIMVLFAFAVITWWIYDGEKKEREKEEND